MTQETISDMFLYHLTLQPPGAITGAIYGNFSAPKTQEIIISRGQILELLRPDDENGRIVSILSWQCFGIIRCLLPFRLTGAQRDYVVVGSDSGRLVILEYNNEKNEFVKIQEETFGKSGCRRIIPGQYLAVDPKGRAVMIGAIEKSKFVYILNRDSNAKLIISSPLEAHKSNTIVFDMCGVDVGYDNPIFACLEIDYEDVERELQEDTSADPMSHKLLTFYELDLGLNHVTRKSADEVDPGANMLISVPGGDDGPGGVLVCAESWLIYQNQDPETEEMRAPIPRRTGFPDDKGLLITCYATHKQRDFYFFLIQSELGDIYKVTLKYNGNQVDDIHIKYFDTTPVASSMCVLKTGYLFITSEFGNHYLFAFRGIGEGDDAPETSSSTPYSQQVYFNPRPLTNLNMVDEMLSLSPLIKMYNDNLLDDDIIMDITSSSSSTSSTTMNSTNIMSSSNNMNMSSNINNNDITSSNPNININSKLQTISIQDQLSQQLYCLCGRGSRSTLRILRHGLSVTEMAQSDIPGNPNAVWSVKASNKDDFHKYIIVSFLDSTMVLSIGETVEEVTDSGFLSNTLTLHVALIGDDILMQIYPRGIKLIHNDGRTKEWKPPLNKRILKASSNNRQVVILLNNNELAYFELDKYFQLMEIARKEIGNNIINNSNNDNTNNTNNSNSMDILDVAIPPINNNINRAKWIAIACNDNTIRILTLDRTSILEQKTLQMLSNNENYGKPSSILFEYLYSTNNIISNNLNDMQLYLYIGTQVGTLIRVTIDNNNGFISDKRERLLGTRAVRLYSTFIRGDPAVVALSSRTWIIYNHQSRLLTTPLNYDYLEYVSFFSSEQCPEGMVSISRKTLRIFTIEKLGEMFNQTTYRLRYTPRDMVVYPPTKQLFIIESDNCTRPYEERKEIEAALQSYEDNNEQKQEVDESFVGIPRAQSGKWASCIRMMDPRDGRNVFLLELEDNEAAFSMTLCQFASTQQEYYLIIGTAKDYQLYPRKVPSAFIRVYHIVKHKKLELIHKTPVNDIPLALCPYKGKLLAGIGKILRLYDIGKKKLLRKSENKNFPQCINKIKVDYNRIYISDICNGLFYATYREQNNELFVFADNITPRHITCFEQLDYDTICFGDRFGNIGICRVEFDDDESDESAIVQTTNKISNNNALSSSVSNVNSSNQVLLNGCYKKLKDKCFYYVGELITSIIKTRLSNTTQEIIIYSTIMGTIGCLIPFETKTFMEYYSMLEIHLREHYVTSLIGRNHLSFRSFYFPVKCIIDGDLCEQYLFLTNEKQKMICEALNEEHSSNIMRKLEQMRNCVL